MGFPPRSVIPLLILGSLAWTLGGCAGTQVQTPHQAGGNSPPVRIQEPSQKAPAPALQQDPPSEPQVTAASHLWVVDWFGELKPAGELPVAGLAGALAPDGRHVAVLVAVEKMLTEGPTEYTSEVHVIDLTAGSVWPTGLKARVAADLAWAPDSDDLAVYYRGQAAVAHLATRTTTRLSQRVEAIAWTPDGKHLALLSPSGREGAIAPALSLVLVDRVTHQLEPGLPVGELDDQTGGIRMPGLAITPDGSKAAVPLGRSARVVALNGGQTISTFDDVFRDAGGRLVMAWSPDGSMLAAGTNLLRMDKGQRDQLSLPPVPDHGRLLPARIHWASDSATFFMQDRDDVPWSFAWLWYSPQSGAWGPSPRTLSPLGFQPDGSVLALTRAVPPKLSQ